MNLSSHLVAAHHRRHPSAPPTVIVQPTRTPGLLSLSKPPRPSPQRQHPQQQHSNPRSQQRSSPKLSKSSATPITSTVAIQRSPQVAHAQPQSQKPAVEKVVSTPIPQEKSQTQSLRGRMVKASQDKAGRRSASQSSTHGRRNHTRQPSPIQPPPAEVPLELPSSDNTITRSNLFDPFSDDFKPVRPTPPLTPRPSGKLAKRRQPIPAFNLADSPIVSSQTKAVNVPRPAAAQKPIFVSRSDPVHSHMPRRSNYRPTPQRSATHDVFPICDDMTELAPESDSEDSELSSELVTPVRPKANWQQASAQYDDGPRTAPLSSTTSAYFPFNSSPSPTPAVRTSVSKSRKHRRAPSESMGVFHMSSDEESTPPSDELKQTLFGLLAPRSGSVGLRVAAAAAAKRDGLELSEKVTGFFASSQFQNSPNPEELPPPAF
ncbi:hypothetical protein ONZ45_g1907 [Pleurotus djamor]|nr:hypothetical protein ONZ45_g1907 [Pleurotus djamor]